MKNLGQILKGFNKTKAELEALEANNAKVALAKRNKAASLIDDAAAKESEAERAAKVRLNIEKFLGGE